MLWTPQISSNQTTTTRYSTVSGIDRMEGGMTRKPDGETENRERHLTDQSTIKSSTSSSTTLVPSSALCCRCRHPQVQRPAIKLFKLNLNQSTNKKDHWPVPFSKLI
jgi:hypothetical protein